MYLRNSRKWYKHIDFILIDLLCAVCTFTGAFRLGLGSYSFLGNILYKRALCMYVFADLITMFIFETYRNVLKRNSREEMNSTIFQMAVLHSVFAAYLLFFQPSLNVPRNSFAALLLIYTGIGFLLREFRKSSLRSDRTSVFADHRKMLIIGTKSNIAQTVRDFRESNYRGYDPVGVCVMDKKITTPDFDGIPVVDKDELLDFATKNWIDEVYIDIGTKIDQYNFWLSAFANMGITTHVVLKPLEAFTGTKQFIEKVGSKYTITSAIATLNNVQAAEKRILDIIGAVVGIAVTAVLTVIIGPMIYLKDPGPIFYKSTRVGRNGKTFQMLKFRSMVKNADDLKEELQSQNEVEGGLMFKMEHDPRIIGGEGGIGEFIRKTSLDEFPQFFNVLIGQMSIVGTRPPTPDEWEKYEPHHRARLSTKPGITGMWQVSGRSDIKDFEQVVHLDREYIANWTIMSDIRIILKTIHAVINRDGAR